MFSIFLLLLSSLGAILAFLGYASQVAIISAFASGITAWQEFSSIARKIYRYNACTVAIEDLVLWWDALSLAQKSSFANINSLVQNGELIINSERSAWMSSPGSGDSKKSDPKNDGESGGDIEETPIQIGSEEKKEA